MHQAMPTAELEEAPPAGATASSAFFDLLYNNFLPASGSDETREFFYEVAGYVVRVRFANSTLVPYIAPALAHLVVEATTVPDLTVCIWDSASTGTKMPPPPWSWDDLLARGEIGGYNDSRIRTAYQLGAESLSMLDMERNLALYRLPDLRGVRHDEIGGAPLRTILYWWLRGRNRQLIHAAAVGTGPNAVLLVGKSGSGKSTTALACLQAGMRYAGDDYVLLDTGRPYIYSIYNSGKLNADHVGRLPGLVPAIDNRERLGEEKALIFLHQHFPDHISRQFRVKAILLPRVTGRPETRLVRVSGATGLAALAPSTVCQLSGAGRPDFQTMAALARQVPSYILELGTDIPAIPAAIQNLLG